MGSGILDHFFDHRPSTQRFFFKMRVSTFLISTAFGAIWPALKTKLVLNAKAKLVACMWHSSKNSSSQQLFLYRSIKQFMACKMQCFGYEGIQLVSRQTDAFRPSVDHHQMANRAKTLAEQTLRMWPPKRRLGRRGPRVSQRGSGAGCTGRGGGGWGAGWRPQNDGVNSVVPAAGR